jgi:site-specific DNA recombinase
MNRSVALIYTRVSKLDDRAISPEMQLARCKDLPAIRGRATEHFEDLDYSGKNTKRPGYQAMIERIRRGDVAVIAAYSLSRISRSVRDFYAFHEEVLRPNEVAFVSATEAIDTSTPQGRAFMGMTAVWAQMERELTSERVRDATEQKVATGGMVGTIPAGYRRGDDGVEVDPEPAETIRLIFRKYATGRHGFGTLARWLNSQGVKPPRSADLNGRPRAELFADETVRQFVSNPRYAGYVERRSGELVRGTHPALIDEQTWAACLRVRKSGFRSWLEEPSPRRTASALAKILLCPTCGGAMRGDSRIRGKRRFRYYSCIRRRKDPRKCSQPFLGQEEIDASARTLLSLVAVPAEMVEAFREAVGTDRQPPKRRAEQVRAIENA